MAAAITASVMVVAVTLHVVGKGTHG
jgi:hypothetical protein